MMTAMTDLTVLIIIVFSHTVCILGEILQINNHIFVNFDLQLSSSDRREY